MEKRQALGKGLSALIPDAPVVAPSRAPLELDVDQIEPGEFQPRLHIDDARLEGLAASIRANGVVQPVVVRRVGGDRYQIIAGERRWRAAQRAGLTRVPVVVKDVPPGQEGRLLEWALIENLQREDLNPIEEATAYQRLATEFQLSHEDIAARVGKDRTTVTNTVRLLRLAPEVRAEVSANALTMGHARALVSLPSDADQRRIAREVIARGLSVRETEALVKRAIAPAAGRAVPAPRAKDADTRAAEDALHRALGAPVEIVRKGRGGSVVIGFASEAELQRLYDLLTEQRLSTHG
ncbi:MAG: ParB/RepB/Spo0J family partition protein [Vicinamibacterales bacterium]